MNEPDNKTLVLAFVGLIAFGIWSAMAYNDPALRPDYLKLIMATVATVVAVALRDLPPPP
jgi:hypothetical protein